MKNNLKFFLLTLFILAISISIFPQKFKTVTRGIEYAEVSREIDKLPVRMNLLRLDLAKVRLDVVHAMDRAIGVETTSSIAKRHRALAAINAGFFRLDKSIFLGDPTGILQIDRVLLSESYSDRMALGITNNGKATSVFFGHLKSSTVLGFGVDSEITVTGINRERKKGDVILYTPGFGPSTLTDDSGAEIVLKVKCEYETASVCRGDIAAFSEGRGDSAIPPDGMVISLDGSMKEFDYFVSTFKHWRGENQLPFRVVSQITFADAGNSAVPGPLEDIIGGSPQLIKNGKIDITWEREKRDKAFVETKHPRTAVAKLKDGKFLMITVDGRSESSGGISLNDLAALLLEFGVIDAMNLDGGGSTTMFAGGKVVNHPSDKEGERKVSDALLVFPRKK